MKPPSRFTRALYNDRLGAYLQDATLGRLSAVLENTFTEAWLREQLTWSRLVVNTALAFAVHFGGVNFAMDIVFVACGFALPIQMTATLVAAIRK